MRIRDLQENNFITKEFLERNKEIKENEMLFQGKQTEVYIDAFLKRLQLAGVRHYKSDKYIGYNSETLSNIYKNILQGVNLTFPICDLYANLLFAEGIKIYGSNQEFLNNLMSELHLNKLFLNGQKINGYKGDVIYLVYEKEGKPYIRLVKTEYYEPVYNENDELVYDALLSKYEYEGKEYLRVSLYGAGKNIHKFYYMKKDEIIEQVKWIEEIFGEKPEGITEEGFDYIQETGLSYSQLIRISNIEVDYSCYGKPFISQTFKEQERELCIRATQRARILDKNADPGMYGPSNIVGLGDDGDPIVATQGKYITVDTGETVPGYITWEGNLEECRLAEEKAEKYIYQETGVNPAILSSTIEGLNIVTGVALERVYARTINTVKTLRNNWEIAIRKIIRLCAEIAGVTITDLQIKWQDGLPYSKREELDAVMIENGYQPIISVKESIKKLYPELTEDKINSLIAEMEEERRKRETPVITEVPDFQV
jgi:hypothetical protein